jgi:WD40 repeat protein
MKAIKIIILFLLCMHLFNCGTTPNRRPIGTPLQNIDIFPQLGHTGSIISVSFSSDGKQILSASIDNTIKLWDIASGREIRSFYVDGLSSASFSPDGRYILAGSWRDRPALLLDSVTGQIIRTFSDHFGPLSFSPDGKMIISSRYIDRTYHVGMGLIKDIPYWDSDEETYDWHWVDYHSIVLWDTITGQEIKVFSEHKGEFTSFWFSPDMSQILSSSDDGTITLWDIASGQEIRSYTVPTGSYTFSPDGRQILIRHFRDGTIKLWDIASSREIRNFTIAENRIVYGGSISFSPDGMRILTSSWEDGIVKLWDTITGREIRTFVGVRYRGDIRIYPGWFSYANPVSFSPDSRQVVAGFPDGTIKLWEAATGFEIRTFSRNVNISPISISPELKAFFFSDNDNEIKLWDISNERDIKTFTEHRSGFGSILGFVNFNTVGDHFFSVSNDGIFRIWDIASRQEIRSIARMGSILRSISINTYGNLISQTYRDGRFHILDLQTGQEIDSIVSTRYVGTGEFDRTSFSPNSNQAIFTDNYNIKLWDMEENIEIRSFSGHTYLIRSVIFSPNGQQALSSSFDGTIRLWDTHSGNEIAKIIIFNDNEWVIITPEGYYDTSQYGDKYLNVRIGNNVYGISTFRSIYHRQDIIRDLLSMWFN